MTFVLITNGSAACNNSDTIIKPEYITVTNIGGPITPSCRPSTTSPGDYGIRRFQFNTIDNATNGSTDGYQDYSCSFITTVSEGRPYSIGINTHPTLPENVWVWIDLDNNGTFDNTAELIYTSLNKAGIHEDTIIIPAGIIYNTPLRMRVASDSYLNIISTPCNPSTNGQYEDYSVILTENNAVVEANFTSDQQNVKTGSTVNFSDKSLNLPTAWQWNFPGGTPSVSTDKNPSVTYLSTGTYNVTLTATNANGSNTITKTNYITVSDTYTMCSDVSSSSSNGLLYDSGGPLGNYSDGE
ncbi:MAG: PKD domain-containing protein, partial [Chloroflexia bacterium]|nr:PKD domain-containing protein [Chloroflexia bacterium]